MFTIISKNLAPFGIGEIVKGGFETVEAAEGFVLDTWGEPGLGQVRIVQAAKPAAALTETDLAALVNEHEDATFEDRGEAAYGRED